MSDKVVLLADGKVVKLIGKDYTISTNGIGYYSIDGSLLKFDLINSNGNSIQYIYLNETDFYKSDQIGDFYIKPAENGYYKFEEVEIYRNSNDNERYRNLKKFLLSYQMLTFAQIGDLIEIRKVEFQSPYTSYYKYFEYKFKIQQLNIDFLDSAQYPSVIDNDPNSPTYNIKSDKSFDYLLNPEGESKFFITNFKNQINNIPENKKAILAKAMTLICFRIYHIMKDDILDIIAIEDIDVIKYTEDPSMLYHEVDQFIWELMKSWGFLGGLEASYILEDKTINAFESYYEGLINLYKFFYLRDENKLFGYDAFGNPLNENGRPLTVIPAEREKVDSERRLSYIIEVLPPSSIALLSYDIKEKYLQRLMEKDSLSREEQGYILNIVYSFVETIDLEEREKFLDFLLIKENGKDTNFDVLFQRMDDKIVSYVLPTISNIFDPEESNKGNFCLALQRIWKNSKYNFYHIPGGTVANEDGMNPNAYFLNDGLKYFDVEGIQIVFDFDTVQTDSWPNYQGHPGIGLMQRVYERYYAHKQLDGERIEITKQILFNYLYLNQDGNPIEQAPDLNRQEKYHFKLHLFQPISIIGYKPNIDSEVRLPEEPYMPAFLFYYQEEFDRLRKKYAQYSFAIDVAVEAISFFTPAVVANIRHLRHLRHVTKIGNAFRQGQGSSEVVYIWKGLTPSSAETFSLLASVCFSFQTYAAAAADDENEREFANKVANIFLLLTLLGVGASLVTRVKLTRSAEEVVNNPKFSTLPSDVRPVIIKLASSIDEAIDVFRTKLNNWPHILSKFDNPAWNDALREAFYLDFKNLSDTDFGRLNDFPTSLDNWKELLDLNINERAIVDFITKQNQVHAIKRYYAIDDIRAILEPLENNKRWKFLDNFGSTSQLDNVAFNKLTQNPKGVDFILEWQKGTKVGPDVFTKEDIIDIIKSDLNENHIDLLTIKNRTILVDAITKYAQEIENQLISISRLNDLQNGNGFGSFVQNLSNTQKKRLQSANRLTVKTQVYNNNVPVGGLKTEKFVSGQEQFVKNKIFGGNLPNEMIEPDYSKFDFFRKKAVDYVPQPRENDTELKYIFNLIEEHWSTGNRFVIEMESTLYTCQSCQGYLVYLKELAKQQGKIVEIKVIAHPDATRIPELIKLIN